MKIINHISWLFVLGLCLLNSCIHDDTTGPYINTSDITVECTGDTAFYLFPKDTLTIDPINDTLINITQTRSEFPLKYTWKIGKITGTNATTQRYEIKDFEVVSEEAVLKYKFDALGQYLVRLEVTNEFGSTFRYFTASVLSAFDAGLVILSENDLGESRLSVLPSRLNEDDLVNTGYAAEHLWHVTGADEPRLREVKDLGYCTHDGQYLIAVAKNPNYSYYLDPITLSIIKGYPLSKAPKRVAVGDAKHSTRIPDQFIFTEDGDVLNLNSNYPKETPRITFTDKHHWDWCQVLDLNEYTYGNNPDNLTTSVSQYMILYDEEENTLYGLGGSGGNNSFKWKVDNGAIFSDSWKFHHLGITQSYGMVSNPQYYSDHYWFVVTAARKSNPDELRSYTLTSYDYMDYYTTDGFTFFWGNQWMFDYPTLWLGDRSLSAENNPKNFEVVELERNSKTVFCQKNAYMYYNTKDKFYRVWTNFGYGIPKAEDACCVLTDSEHPNVEIMDYVLGQTQQYFYVAVYEPDSPEEMKGSIWVYRYSDMKKVKEYNNIIDKPVRLYYKKKA